MSGKVLPMHGPIVLDGEEITGEDLEGALGKKWQEAFAKLKAEGYRRFRVEIAIHGVGRRRPRIPR